jgi:hypothetical protein
MWRIRRNQARYRMDGGGLDVTQVGELALSKYAGVLQSSSILEHCATTRKYSVLIARGLFRRTCGAGVA